MKILVAVLLVTTLTTVLAYQPRIKIYEIRKPNNDNGYDTQESKLETSNGNKLSGNNINLLQKSLLQVLQNIQRKGSAEELYDDFLDENINIPIKIISEKTLNKLISNQKLR